MRAREDGRGASVSDLSDVELAARLDGSPLVYNQADTNLPDLLICRPELAERVRAALFTRQG